MLSLTPLRPADRKARTWRAVMGIWPAFGLARKTGAAPLRMHELSVMERQKHQGEGQGRDGSQNAVKRRWRQYKTAVGNEPVKKFIGKLSDNDAASIAAAMKEVREKGTAAARHLRGDIWEVRADGDHTIYRVLFAEEGKHSQVLLAVEAFQKKTQKTPPEKIALAESRLRDWRKRSS